MKITSLWRTQGLGGQCSEVPACQPPRCIPLHLHPSWGDTGRWECAFLQKSASSSGSSYLGHFLLSSNREHRVIHHSCQPSLQKSLFICWGGGQVLIKNLEMWIWLKNVSAWTLPPLHANDGGHSPQSCPKCPLIDFKGQYQNIFSKNCPMSCKPLGCLARTAVCTTKSPDSFGYPWIMWKN